MHKLGPKSTKIMQTGLCRNLPQQNSDLSALENEKLSLEADARSKVPEEGRTHQFRAAPILENFTSEEQITYSKPRSVRPTPWKVYLSYLRVIEI